MPVEFKTVHFRQVVFLSEETTCKLNVHIQPNTGQFEIVDDHGSLLVTGNIKRIKESEEVTTVTDKQEEVDKFSQKHKWLDGNCLYQETHASGFEYGPEFQIIKFIDITGINFVSYVKYTYNVFINWIH